MYKKLDDLVRSTHFIFSDERKATLIIPYGFNKEQFISYIEAMLNFVELNALTINTAKTLFQDCINMLNYHPCNFCDTNKINPQKDNSQGNGRLKYAMYKEHNILPGEFVSKYKISYVPLELPQNVYFEMLLQLDDFIREKDLTIKQAEYLLSDCIELLLYSKL